MQDSSLLCCSVQVSSVCSSRAAGAAGLGCRLLQYLVASVQVLVLQVVVVHYLDCLC